jgi:hypothetical protein
MAHSVLEDEHANWFAYIALFYAVYVLILCVFYVLG